MPAVNTLEKTSLSAHTMEMDGQKKLFVSQEVNGLDPIGIAKALSEMQEVGLEHTQEKIDKNKLKIDAIKKLEQLANEFRIHSLTLRNSLNPVDTSSNAFEQFAVFGSDANTPNMFSVSTSKGVTAGQMKLNVERLASYDVKNGTTTYGSSDAVMGLTAGTITINSQDFPVDGTTTLSGLVNAINANQLCNAKATVLQRDANNYIISIQGSDLATQLTLTGTATIWTELGVDNSVTPAQDLMAKFTYQQANEAAETIYSTSNTQNGTLKTGVNVTFLNTTGGSTVSLTFSPSVTGVMTSVKAWADAYNALREEILAQKKITIDPATGDAVISDDAVLYFENQLDEFSQKINRVISTAVLGANVSPYTGEFQLLSDVGIKTFDITDVEHKNLMEIDSEVLQAAIEANLDKFKSLFGDNYSSTNSKFSVADIGKTLNSEIAGQEISVQYARSGSNYTATLSYGSGPTVVVINSTNPNLFEGEEGTVFEGVVFTYDGTIADGSNDTSTVRMTRGIAANTYQVINEMVQKSPAQDARAPFSNKIYFFETWIEKLNQEIKSDSKAIADMKERAATQFKRLQSRMTELYAAVAKANEVSGALNALNKVTSGESK